DLVLIDELVGLLDGVPTYGHVVIDEAQDLSPMQCRAIARRSVAGSVTVLGDLAQATTPWAPGDWALTLDHLGHPDATVQPLTAGYRVPGSVLDLANRLLPHIATGLQPATSVRPGVGAVTAHRRADLVPTVRSLLAGVGSIGVIGADREVGALLGELADLGAAELTGDADPRLAVVASRTAKGLEFDAVVVVEPAHLVGSEVDRRTGLRRLYVALTRAVSHLVLVHDSALPVELTG
ncbi:MAG: ATP-binding domain-containing protein, partial [Mycobacteriales bacterium]